MYYQATRQLWYQYQRYRYGCLLDVIRVPVCMRINKTRARIVTDNVPSVSIRRFPSKGYFLSKFLDKDKSTRVFSTSCPSAGCSALILWCYVSCYFAMGCRFAYRHRVIVWSRVARYE